MQLESRVAKPVGPAIVGIPKRGLFSDLDEGRAIARACEAARGIVHPCPVIFGGRIVGFVRGENAYSDRVHFEKVPAQYNMAWTNYNDIITALTGSQRFSKMWFKQASATHSANTWYDFWPITGYPGPGTLAGAAATANIYDDTSTGVIYTGGNKSPLEKYLVSTQVMVAASSEVFIIYDRVLDYQSCVYTAGISTVMTNVSVAQRYVASGQPGLQMMWAVDTTHNATASNITVLTYDTPSAAGHTMPTTPTVSIVPSTNASTTTAAAKVIAPATSGDTITWGPFMPLASGDTGATKVIDYTTSAANTGTFYLALIYPVAYVPYSSAFSPMYLNHVFQLPTLTRIYDGAALCVMTYNSALAGISTWGNIDVAWG